MRAFSTCLVPGRRRPYTHWTFIELPADVDAALGGRWPQPVRGTLSGTPFRGTAARGEGVVRVPVNKALMETARVARGDAVQVELELDTEPRPLRVPAELARLFEADTELERRFHHLPPSLRRAWVDFVAEAKRPETRVRRAAAAPAGVRSKTWPR